MGLRKKVIDTLTAVIITVYSSLIHDPTFAKSHDPQSNTCENDRTEFGSPNPTAAKDEYWRSTHLLSVLYFYAAIYMLYSLMFS